MLRDLLCSKSSGEEEKAKREGKKKEENSVEKDMYHEERRKGKEVTVKYLPECNYDEKDSNPEDGAGEE